MVLPRIHYLQRIPFHSSVTMCSYVFLCLDLGVPNLVVISAVVAGHKHRLWPHKIGLWRQASKGRTLGCGPVALARLG